MAGFAVASPDGARITAQVSGSGPPLVLLHGTSGDHASFRFVEPLLAEGFTVYAVDRRGRRESSDGSEYALEREFEDAAVVVDSIGGSVDLFGHSYGADVALGAAPLARNLRRLVLYEPAPGLASVPAEFVERLESLLEQGDREQLMTVVMIEFAGFGPEMMEAFRASPSWAHRVAAAHTIPRELRAEEAWAFEPEGYQGFTAPTLLLLGSESPEWASRGTEIVAAAVPTSRVAVLEGHGHVATMTGPELLASKVVAFLSEP